MPWDIKKDGEKYLVVEEDGGKVVGTHDSEEKAKRQLAALNANVKHAVLVAFEPFAAMEYGKPLKLLPIGTFYRGKRKLEVTRSILQEMLDNFKQGLPRYRVGINLNHKEDIGKVGDILDLDLRDDGLYASRYELSERGKKAIEEEGYDATSAEVVWSQNGATYQDPETGNEHDNVLVGAALTPRPFFGHKHVALFSADVDIDDTSEEDAKEPPTTVVPPGEGESSKKEEEMAEDTQKAEEFAAKLQEKDTEIERLTAEATAASERLAAVETERAAETRAKRVEELKAEALAYESISLDADKYVANILSLEGKAPDEAAWVKEQFAALDKTAKAAGVTEEIGSDREGEDLAPAEQFIGLVSKMVDGEFKGDSGRWAEAMAIVGASHPQLAEAYAAAIPAGAQGGGE